MAEQAQPSFSLQERFQTGVAHLKAQEYPEAETVNRGILKQRSDLPEVHHNLGLALKGQRRWEEAIAEFRIAIKLRPKFPEPWNSMGDTLRELNCVDEAFHAVRHALALRPEHVDGWINLGVLFRQTKKPVEAIEAYRRALALQPTSSEAWNNLGNALCDLHQGAKAIEVFQKALALKSDDWRAWNNLGNAWRQTEQHESAIEAYRKSLALNPKYAEAMNNMAGSLQSLGQLDEALECFDQAIALLPDYPEAHDGRLCTAHYHPAFDAAAIYREAMQWSDRFAWPVSGEIIPCGNDPTPNRRLRIGYISPDFRLHCSMLFIAPLLQHHNRDQFEVYCYSNVAISDTITERWRGHVNGWRDIAAQGNATVADLVRQDKIDILVDLALHVVGGRLGVFARKPAPVQVTWLGYPGTTGMETIDYRLTDPRLDPLGSSEPEIRNPKSEIRINDQIPNDPNPNDSITPSTLKQPVSLPHSDIGKLTSASAVEPGFDSDFGFRASDFENRVSDFATKEPSYSERSVRLRDCFWCYDPHGMEETADADIVLSAPPPALTLGYVTLGCLNNFCKVTEPTLALWASVMAALPNSRLILLAPVGEHRQRIWQKLGVGTERVEFVVRQPRRAYLETYRRIDLCLDTIPYNGHTTTLDALWMGVPVVTRVGKTVVGRAGWSFLHQLGLMELVARSDQEFVEAAVGLAKDQRRLEELHQTLRTKMESSPLMDGKRFTTNVESVYRRMWQVWCEGR